ncbi:hypothetical protein WJX82_008128 [Trebouxia sp. C0006]
MVAVTIQTVSGKRYSLQFTDQQQVDDLKQQIAHTTGVPADKLRLVHKGKAIHNDHVVSLSDQDIILAMRTRPPAAMHAARQQGEASAYSIFNNFQELPGQLNAHRLDDQLRHGQM